jgi:hypothetical protein
VPRYFFNLCNSQKALDPERRELPNSAVALHEAAKEARALAAESVNLGELCLEDRIEVLDAYGQLVGNVYFRDVVRARE